MGRDFGTALRALRDGVMGFDQFLVDHRWWFVRWASSEITRWPPNHLTVDDLVQDGLVECWRSVEYWDPDRGMGLASFVKVRVIQRLRKVLVAVSGNPRPGLTVPMRPVRMSAEMEADYERCYGKDSTDRVEVAEVLNRCESGIVRDSAVGVVLGMDSAAIAAHLYLDVDRRLEYRFDSMRQARQKVRRAIDCATRQIVENA